MLGGCLCVNGKTNSLLYSLCKIGQTPFHICEKGVKISLFNDFKQTQKQAILDEREIANGDGYICLNLNNSVKRSKHSKHDLIAVQLIENDKPEYKKAVDHVNHIRDDNRIENLVWFTQASNCRNKLSNLRIEYDFDDLSDEAIDVTDYGKHEFEDYIYDPATENFYYYTGDKCRKLHDNIDKKTGALFVYMRDTNNNKVQVYYKKFKKIYGFI